MKKIFSALLVMVCAFSFASAQEVVNGPAITLDKTVHDYGTIEQGANGEPLARYEGPSFGDVHPIIVF